MVTSKNRRYGEQTTHCGYDTRNQHNWKLCRETPFLGCFTNLELPSVVVNLPEFRYVVPYSVPFCSYCRKVEPWEFRKVDFEGVDEERQVGVHVVDVAWSDKDEAEK